MAGENKEKKSILKMDVSDIIKAFKKKNSEKKNDKKGSKKKAKSVICKKAISIDIGSNNTKIIVGRYHKNKVSIDKAFSFKTPKDSIDDGHIKDIYSLARAITDALDSNNVKNDNVIFTTNSTSVINRTIIIPKVNEDEIES
ncbi:type IV pilus biogenesis protein PilM, partial [Clostridium perfringens]|uniref:type IV pilus biogenesis protein PilM n=1 Tax=Clostridium perfringens TaxID=1502 RepID=UPI0039EBD6BC